ncbi:MAG: M48 family metalloprotease [Acidobacteria bacterium]|nr:M48 family metalloprotease [Acidobacteriota bacterium]
MTLDALAQGSRVEMPKNKYSVSQDVQLGRQAAGEVRQQMPLLSRDSRINDYVEDVGRRLVSAIPREYQQSGFQYSFEVVNASDINAFALPGGPMFVNRGMIEAARTEGEMAGVMAHEISHVVLRHGTAQATKANSAKFQLPAIGGAILGAILGGNVGSVISQGTQFGLGAYFLKYSREYERDADILGAQIMARAGYDPRDLANMFRTIERQSGGSSGPEWLSSHPNPGNRYQVINEEASRLRVSGSSRSNSAEFSQVQSELRRMSKALTMQEIANRQTSQNTRSYPAGSRVEQNVEYPAGNYRAYRGSNLFEINVPGNWQAFEEQSSVTFAPRGAYGNYQGQSVFTHGAIVGIANVGSRNLQAASEQYINGLLQNNSYLQAQGRFRRSTIDGRQALAITLTGRSPVTGANEAVMVYTSLLRNGNLFYVINVVPREQYRYYERAFNTMLQSINLNG